MNEIKLKLLQHNLNRSKGNVENYKTFFNHAFKNEMFFLAHRRGEIEELKLV